MVGIQCVFTPEVHQALKQYALKYGFKSKAAAAAHILHVELAKQGYDVDPNTEYGYEYLEDA